MAMRASDMSGKAALVTGASGDLGKATAIALAVAGADVCLVDPDEAALEAIAVELNVIGVRTTLLATEVRGTANCRAAVEAALGAFGRLDTLCTVANVLAPA